MFPSLSTTVFTEKSTTWDIFLPDSPIYVGLPGIGSPFSSHYEVITFHRRVLLSPLGNFFVSTSGNCLEFQLLVLLRSTA